MPTTFLYVVAMLAFAGYVAFTRFRQYRERSELQAQHPSEPWLWRRDWAERAVRDDVSTRSQMLWFAGAIWLLMSLPVLFPMLQQGKRDPVLLIFLSAFVFIGVCLLGVAAFGALRRHKYGISICRISETILWQNEQTVPGSAAMRGPEGTRIAVRFAVPGDAKPTNESDHHDSIVWRLEVKADVPGFDYAARFTLPVFAVSDREPARF